MSEFHKEDEHIAFSLLFDSTNIENRYKDTIEDKLPYFVVIDKEEKRLEGMFNSAAELGRGFNHHKTSALAIVCMASSYEEGLLMHAGLLPVSIQGISVCMACLGQAIKTGEEQLEVLRDLEKLATGYAAKL
jgi:hypothetical protein